MKKFRVVLDVQTSGVDEFTFHIEDQNVNTLEEAIAFAKENIGYLDPTIRHYPDENLDNTPVEDVTKCKELNDE